MKDQAIKLLHVDSSNLQENSVTRQFSAEVMAEWLKAWIDRLSQADRTFKNTESGSVGLAVG